jgi:hypothetical protein
VCMCLSLCVCVCVWCACVFIYYVSTNVFCMYICMYVCMCACMCVHASMYVRMYVHVYIHMVNTWVYIYVYICMVNTWGVDTKTPLLPPLPPPRTALPRPLHHALTSPSSPAPTADGGAAGPYVSLSLSLILSLSPLLPAPSPDCPLSRAS